MTTRENFASFHDVETGQVVYVDSFDNHEFNVRFGTEESTVDLGTIKADSDEMLNAKLDELVLKQVAETTKPSLDASHQ
jgi:hypothetical protein